MSVTEVFAEHSNSKRDIGDSKKKEKTEHNTGFSRKSCVLFPHNLHITKSSTPPIVSKLGLRAMFAPSFGYQQMLNDGASFMQIYTPFWLVECKSAFF